jgi:hypothetical protein
MATRRCYQQPRLSLQPVQISDKASLDHQHLGIVPQNPVIQIWRVCRYLAEIVQHLLGQAACIRQGRGGLPHEDFTVSYRSQTESFALIFIGLTGCRPQHVEW